MKPSDSFYLSIWGTALRAALERKGSFRKKYSESRERQDDPEQRWTLTQPQPSTINLALRRVETQEPPSAVL